MFSSLLADCDCGATALARGCPCSPAFDLCGGDLECATAGQLANTCQVCTVSTTDSVGLWITLLTDLYLAWIVRVLFAKTQKSDPTVHSIRLQLTINIRAETCNLQP